MPRGMRRFKMMGGGLTCPPGFHCMDTGTILMSLFALVSLAAVVFVVLKYNGFFAPGAGAGAGAAAAAAAPQQKPTVVVVHQGFREGARAPTMIVNPDPRFSPLPPEQSYASMPDIRGHPRPAGLGPVLPVNMQTRGYPDQFQQVGLLTAPGGTETSGTPNRTILPLFGRTIDSNRNRWNYYTRTDGINPVQVPIQFKRRNCDDDNGCDEITDGDSIGVPVMGQSFTASVYRYSTPRYMPVV